MKRKIYKMPKMKLPVLKYCKFEKIWQKQSFTPEEKKRAEQLAEKIDGILKNIPLKERSRLAWPPCPTYDPSVTVGEWNDFLAVAFGVKPSCTIGLNYHGKTYNPIAKFARKYRKIFPHLSFADYWEFGPFKNNQRTYDKVEDGFIYDQKKLGGIVKKFPKLFIDLNLQNLNPFLKQLVVSSDKNRFEFHKKLGLLLGYSQGEIDRFIKNEQKYYH